MANFRNNVSSKVEYTKYLLIEIFICETILWKQKLNYYNIRFQNFMKKQYNVKPCKIYNYFVKLSCFKIIIRILQKGTYHFLLQFSLHRAHIRLFANTITLNNIPSFVTHSLNLLLNQKYKVTYLKCSV